MKILAQVISYFSVIVGGLALLGGLVTETGKIDSYAVIGGLLFLTQGVVTLVYVYTQPKIV